MRRVGICINPHSARGMGLLRGVGRFVRSKGDWLVNSIYHDKATSLAAELKNRPCDGILASIESNDDFELLKREPIPVVDVWGRFGCEKIASVTVDHYKIGLMSYAHLISCGVPNLAFYGFASDRAGQVHLDAIMRCAQADQRDITVGLIESELPGGLAGKSSEDSLQGERDLDRWITSLPKPVGVIAGDDTLGKRVLDACFRCGMRVPDTVAVIGTGSDETFREFCMPALSSVPVPNERIGYQAAELLSILMDGKKTGRHEILVSPIAVAARCSTEGPATRDITVTLAIKFIQENACKGINTEDVLDHLAQKSFLISRSTLERRFRETLRHSPKDEILRVRIARAGELLMSTTYPLSKIAELVGIQRPEHFSATFKRLTGQLPGELRRNAKNSA